MQESLAQQTHSFCHVPSIDSRRTPSPQPWLMPGWTEVERRQVCRFRVQKHLLSVCANYAGQILDISRTGLAFRLVHFLPQAGGKRGIHPHQSDTLDILSPGLDGYFFKDLRVRTVCDRSLGRLYPENKDLILYRRSVRLLEPLHADQLASLQRYLEGNIHEAAAANYFS